MTAPRTPSLPAPRRFRASAAVRVGFATCAFLFLYFPPQRAHAEPTLQAPAFVPSPTSGQPAAQSVSLPDALVLARTRGYDALVAAAAVRGAEADVRAAGQTPNPTLSGGVSRRVDCFSGTCSTPWGGFANLSDEGLIEGALTRKRSLREDVAKNALDAVRYGRADAERSLVAQTKVQYVQAAAAQARLELSREVAASLQKSVDINRVRYPRVIDEGQLARVELESMRAQQEVERALREVRQQQIELSFLLGTPGPIPELLVDRKALDFRVPEALKMIDRPALLRAALEHRPDRLQALARVTQTEAAIALARRKRIPDVALLVQYQQLGSGDNPAQPPTLSVGVGLPLPLFYQQQGEIGRAEADRQSSMVERRRLEAMVAAELESALMAFTTARRLVERYESALLERAKRALEITQVQFTAGSATLTDLLDAQRSYVSVNSGYLAELLNYWTATFQVEQAVGKDFIR